MVNYPQFAAALSQHCLNLSAPTGFPRNPGKAAEIMQCLLEKDTIPRNFQPFIENVIRPMFSALSTKGFKVRWDQRVNEKWFPLLDHGHLTHPDMVCAEDLTRGSVPYRYIPMFGLASNEEYCLRGRTIQFLIDFYGIFAVYRLSTAGALFPLILDLEAWSHQLTSWGDAPFHYHVMATTLRTYASVIDNAGIPDELYYEVLFDELFPQTGHYMREAIREHVLTC